MPAPQSTRTAAKKQNDQFRAGGMSRATCFACDKPLRFHALQERLHASGQLLLRELWLLRLDAGVIGSGRVVPRGCALYEEGEQRTSVLPLVRLAQWLPRRGRVRQKRQQRRPRGDRVRGETREECIRDIA